MKINTGKDRQGVTTSADLITKYEGDFTISQTRHRYPWLDENISLTPKQALRMANHIIEVLGGNHDQSN